MLSLNETITRIRQGHLLVRSPREWNELSSALLRAYDAKDDELVERLRAPFLQSWRTVTTLVLADTFDAAGITITPAAHPWGIATLAATNLNCEPLLCEAEDGEDGRAAAAVHGGLQLLDFDSIMTGYATCVNRLRDQYN